MADGLIQGTVQEIYQDSKGRMWFGTVDGLSIYDGSEFYNYTEDEGLKVPIISGFLEISDGVMLVATLGNGIEVFVKHPYKQDSIAFTINNKKFLIDPRVNQIKRDKYGSIWICTEAGITKWVFENNSFTNVVHENDFNGLGELSVYSVSFGQDEKIYFGTSKGLLEYNNSKYHFITQEFKKKCEPVIYTYVDRQNTLWFSSLKKFFYVKNGKVEEFKFNGKPLDIVVNAITERNADEIIIGSLGKIIILRKDSNEIIEEKNGLTENSLLSLFIDREDNLWIGSLEGLSRLNKSNFRFVNLNSVKLNYPNLIKTNNQLYLGNVNGLYLIRNFELDRLPKFKELESMRILDYMVDGKNEWFATDRGVILRQSGRNKIYDDQNGLPNNFVYSIYKDSTGIIWILTQGGLAYVKNGSLYNFKTSLESGWKYSDLECQYVLSSTSIRYAVIDNKNTKWITTWRNGLIRIRNDSIYRFTEKDGLNDLRVRSLYLDSKNNLWIGTRFNGVYKYDGKSFFNYSTKDGLNSNWVFSITEDYKKNFWFCTSKGINKFDGNKWVSFGAADGILGGEILKTVQNNNIMWFNSWEQIFCYLPDSKNEQKIKPTVYFKQISLLDANLQVQDFKNFSKNFNLNELLNIYKESEPVEIDYANNTIIFDFAGTSYRGDKQTVYNYKLDGFDKHWIKSTNRNYVTYTHLPPGNYNFVVYTVNREGEKSESPATFTFTIISPFWLRWWFIASSVLFFILIISFINYLIYQYKIRQALKIEKLRLKISSDLHDEIGTSLSSIAIFAELIKRDKKSSDNKFSDKLERIENISRELVDKMSDIVWMVNPGNDKFEDALLKLKDYALTILESRDIDVVFNVDEFDKDFVLAMELRRNLLLIYKELITNAAKYSKAKKVIIQLKLEENHTKKIILIIKDNGIGFDYNTIRKGNGVKNIIRRSEELGGKCDIITKPGNGTIAKIEIPLN